VTKVIATSLISDTDGSHFHDVLTERIKNIQGDNHLAEIQFSTSRAGNTTTRYSALVIERER
jgi:hypothetical protein